MTVYYVNDGGDLYLALQMNDPTYDSTDSIRVLFDTTANGGDPDSADRYFEVFRDGSSRVWAGVGSNVDGQMWDPAYSSSSWDYSVSEQTGQWVTQIYIDASEMPALANPFGQMFQANFSGDLATWPSSADGNSAGSWLPVDKPPC